MAISQVSTLTSTQHLTSSNNRYILQLSSQNAATTWSSFYPLILSLTLLCSMHIFSFFPFCSSPAALNAKPHPHLSIRFSLFYWQLFFKNSLYSALNGHCPLDTQTTFCALALFPLHHAASLRAYFHNGRRKTSTVRNKVWPGFQFCLCHLLLMWPFTLMWRVS